MLETVNEAFDLLTRLNADRILLRHAEIVHEVAQLLVEILYELNVEIDTRLVLMGAVLHDAGKIIHREELDETGRKHESAGKALLLSKGVDEQLARMCKTRALWNEATALEDLVVALADKLWKGQRNAELEQLVIRRCAEQIASDFWQLFVQLDTYFEAIAADGHARLIRSRE